MGEELKDRAVKGENENSRKANKRVDDEGNALTNKEKKWMKGNVETEISNGGSCDKERRGRKLWRSK